MAKDMKVTIKKWGNSLGIRIPKIIADDLDLKDGSTVDIEDREGSIIITTNRHSLDELLGKINDSNIHHETDLGKPDGREAW